MTAYLRILQPIFILILFSPLILKSLSWSLINYQQRPIPKRYIQRSTKTAFWLPWLCKWLFYLRSLSHTKIRIFLAFELIWIHRYKHWCANSTVILLRYTNKLKEIIWSNLCFFHLSRDITNLLFLHKLKHNTYKM